MEELLDQAEKMEEEALDKAGALDRAGAGWQELCTRQELEDAPTEVDGME